MPYHRPNPRQLLNLEFLVETSVIPALQRWTTRERESVRIHRAYLAASVVESFSLLRLSAQVGFLDLADAVKVANLHSGAFFEAFSAAISEGLESSFDLISQAKTIEEFLETPKIFFLETPELFQIPFRTFVLLRRQYLSGESLFSFSSKLPFLNPREWSAWIRDDQPDYGQIFDVMFRLPLREELNEVTLFYVGFVQMLRYIGDLEHYSMGVLAHLRVAEATDPEDSFRKYFRQLGHVQRWRLDLRRPEVEGRIDMLIKRVAAAISGETGGQEGRAFSARASRQLKIWRGWIADAAMSFGHQA